jgi:peroxin-6
MAPKDGKGGRLIRRGDVIAVPVYQDRPLLPEQEESPSTSDADSSDSEANAQGAPFKLGWNRWDGKGKAKVSTGVAYFVVTSLSFDPLVPIEEDFRSSTSSKARAGEMGCWVDVAGSGGGKGATRMGLTGLERLRVSGREGDRASLSLCELSLWLPSIAANTSLTCPYQREYRHRGAARQAVD